MRDVSVDGLLKEMEELFNSYKRIDVNMLNAGWTCHCDPDQVRQVLINLMDNALAATETSSGRSVRMYSRVSEEYAEWHVEDDGEGIDATAVSQLFEAYYSTKASGSGLGLAIAKRIAEDHGGGRKGDFVKRQCRKDNGSPACVM